MTESTGKPVYTLLAEKVMLNRLKQGVYTEFPVYTLFAASCVYTESPVYTLFAASCVYTGFPVDSVIAFPWRFMRSESVPSKIHFNN